LRHWSRRRFLTAAGLVGVGLAAGVIGWRRRRLIEWMARPPVVPAPPGSLPEHAGATLLAAARTLLDDGITAGCYADYFRWRAENVRGYRALYVAFAAHLDGAARRAGARDFASAGGALRRSIVADLSPRRSWERLGEGLLRRADLRYSQQIVREIFRIFSRTDAWLRAGYDNWPGVPGDFARLAGPPRGGAA